MTRRAIDIDDETWRRIKVEAAEKGITAKELVNYYLRWAIATHPLEKPDKQKADK
jgi:site-specific recombinase XerD